MPPSYVRQSITPHDSRAVALSVVSGPDHGRQHVPDTVRPVSVGRAKTNDLALEDRSVDLFQAEFFSAPGGIRVSDLGGRKGVQIGSVRILDAVVPAGSEITIGETRICVEETRLDSDPASASQSSPLPGVIGSSYAIRELQRRAAILAAENTPVLIEGERGCGKELFGKGIHALSPRSANDFVSLSCHGKSVTALAAELYGFEVGAFPGADRTSIGALEKASGGTLLLRDVGDLHIPIQASLFGALKHKRFRRLGSRNEIPLDARIIVSTRRDIRPQVNRKGFRDDLYEALQGVRLYIPPLRERPEDIDLLVQYLVTQGASPPGSATLRALREHRWSGNVAELREVLLSRPNPAAS